MDKILLETSFYSLSEDIVRFKISKWGFRSNVQKCDTYIAQMDLPQHACSDDIMASASKGSFIRHYCVANSLGEYMHSLSAF